MNPEAATTAVQALSWNDMAKVAIQDLITRLQAGADWATMQIPDVLQQYIMFKAIHSGSLMVFGLILTAAGLFYFAPRFKACMAKETPTDADIAPGVGLGVATAFCCMAGPTIICVNFTTFILAVFAPKVLILEQLIQVAGGRSIL